MILYFIHLCGLLFTFKIETTHSIEEVKIYSVLGELIQTYSKQTVYDISHLSSGVYSVVIDNVFYTVLVKRLLYFFNLLKNNHYKTI